MQKGRGVPCSPKTLARRITSIKAFFRWLHEYGVLLIDPAEKVVQRSVISPLPQVLTVEEVKAIYRVAEDFRNNPPMTPATLPYSISCCTLASRRVKRLLCR